MEINISFSLRNLRFIDNAQLLLAWLERLVVAGDERIFEKTQRYAPAAGPELLFRKGVCPYMNSLEYFDEDQLPPKGAFTAS